MTAYSIMTTYTFMTDLEPDDVQMIWSFVVKYRTSYKLTLNFIVGEGDDMDLKVSIMWNLINNLKIDYGLISWTFNVYKGEGSSKKYPKTYLDACIQPNVLRNIAPDDPFMMSEDLQHILVNIIQESQVLYLMSPPRLFFTEAFKNLTFKNTTVVMYGSFNLRTLKFHEKPLDSVVNFFDSFKTVYYLESFTTFGEDNSISAAQYPQLYLDEFSVKIPETMKFFKQITYNWNMSIVGECHNKVNDPNTSEESKKRNQKIINNIGNNLHTQFVCADGILTFIDVDDDPNMKNVKLSGYKGEYPQFRDVDVESNEESNFYILQLSDEQKKLYKKKFVESVHALFRSLL